MTRTHWPTFEGPRADRLRLFDPMTAARRLDRLAVLQILQGGFECATGNAMAFLGLLGALSPGGSGEYWVQISLAFLAVGLLGGTVVLLGILRVLAGALNACLRGRRFGKIVLLAGLLSCATCVCLPTSLVLCLYGWHVYGSEDVRKLMQLGNRPAGFPKSLNPSRQK